MGDRGVIRVYDRHSEDGERSVYLYGHWSGAVIWRDLQEALKQDNRWSDPYILAGVIFLRMAERDKGLINPDPAVPNLAILPRRILPDGFILGVNCQDQIVTIETEDHILKSISFSDYVSLKRDPRLDLSPRQE